MNWEEYINSDWYRESHPERFEKPSKEDLTEQEMRTYLGCLDCYRQKIEEEKQKYADEDGYYPACLDNGILVEDQCDESKVVCYVTTKIFNGRVRGLIRRGTYKECLLSRYEYNIACIDSEWHWAGVERITASNEDELDDIICGYYECEFDYDDYDEY